MTSPRAIRLHALFPEISSSATTLARIHARFVAFDDGGTNNMAMMISDR
jgi:hypothetical protein